jgi:signal transduction histidine kinase/ActR/RegA family two-component response regulator
MLKFGIAGKLLIFSMMMFFGFIVLSGLASWKLYESISDERADKVRSLSEVAASMVQIAYDRYQSGELTEAAAQNMVKNELRKIKYNKNEYYFIYDYDGFNVMHGSKPEREGKNFYTDLDPNGLQYVKAQIDRARDGTGSVYELFPRLGSTEPVRKLTYQVAFDPWRWVIGTGVYIDDIDARFVEVARQFLSIAVALGLLMGGGAYLLSRGITRPLGRLVEFTARPLSEPPSGALSRDMGLRDEVGTLARALRTFKAKAAEAERLGVELATARNAEAAASRAKSDFLSSMSHELRTPLNAVIGFAQMMELDGDHVLSPRQKEYLGYIVIGGDHLLTLVNEVLDLARIETGRLTLSIESVAISDMLDSIQATMWPLARRTDLKFDVARPHGMTHVRADELRLRQVLINLVSNAIKYNRQGGSVSVAARSLPDGKVRFVVADTGIGIPSDRQSDLFEPFQRLGAEHSAVEGTGIGLALTRRMVEAMDGAIGFTSELGQGSVFWVELSGATADEAAATTVVSPAHSISTMVKGRFSLLYVEDDPANLRLMEHLISTLPNGTILTAATPQLGIELAMAHRPDIIVLDLNLPGMSGYDVLARVRAMPETCDIPVLALTADVFPHQFRKGLAAGFFRYLSKPLDIGIFLAAVGDALDRSAARPVMANGHDTSGAGLPN